MADIGVTCSIKRSSAAWTKLSGIHAVGDREVRIDPYWMLGVAPDPLIYFSETVRIWLWLGKAPVVPEMEACFPHSAKHFPMFAIALFQYA